MPHYDNSKFCHKIRIHFILAEEMRIARQIGARHGVNGIVGRLVDGRVRHSCQCMLENSNPFRCTLSFWEVDGLWGRRISDGTT